MNTVIDCMIHYYEYSNRDWLKIFHIDTVSKKQLFKLESKYIICLRLNVACRKCKKQGFDFCSNKYDLFYGGCIAKRCVGCCVKPKNHIQSTVGIIVYWHYYNKNNCLSYKLWPIIVPAFVDNSFVNNLHEPIMSKKRVLLEFATLCVSNHNEHIPYFVHLYYMLSSYCYDNHTSISDINTSIIWEKGQKMTNCECVRISEYKILANYDIDQKLWHLPLVNLKLPSGVLSFLYHISEKCQQSRVLVYKSRVKADYDYLFIRKCKQCLVKEQASHEMRSLYYHIIRQKKDESECLLSLLKSKKEKNDYEYRLMIENLLGFGNHQVQMQDIHNSNYNSLDLL